MWNSETYGQLGLNEIPDKLMLFYDRNAVYGEPMELTIGTDSQNHASGTKIVTVISMICKGHGGIFFYETEFRDLIKVVKQKLETETYISLETAKMLLDELDNGGYRILVDNCPLSIHIETVCLLSNRKPDSYVHLNLKMEDYYRIKDAQEEQDKK